MRMLGLLIAAVAARAAYLSRGRRLPDGLVYVAAARALAIAVRGEPADRALTLGVTPEAQA